jgi:multidrug efflux pump subunit AcrA (membrane-fusion protein)
MKKSAGIALAAALCFWMESCSSQTEEKSSPLVEVKLGTPTRQDLALLVTGPATIFPREQANLASRITAPIRELKVHKGQTVPAGQTVAVLDNRDLMAQQAEASAAETEARETLEKTRNSTLPSDLERARGTLAAAQAAYNQSEQLYARRKQLYEEGAIPQRDLLQTQTDLATNKANYEVAQRSLQILQNQSNKRDIAIAESKLEQAQARLKQQNATLGFSEIRSPFAGTITEQLMYPGDMANSGATIFTIADLSVVTARAQIPEAHARALRPGQPCSFSPQDRPGESITGHLTVVNRAVDPQRQTVEVWCEIQSPPASLRVSEFGQVSITTGIEKQALVIPVSAAERKEETDTATVTVVDDQMTAHKKEVRTGIVRNGVMEIQAGLSGTERLVMEGNYETPEGAKVAEAGQKQEEHRQEMSSKP